MAVLTTEYMIITAVALAVILIFGLYLLGYIPSFVAAPKIQISANLTRVVYTGNVLYIDTYITSTSNTKVCIDAVVVNDLTTGNSIIIGNSSSPTNNLPICISPSTTFHFAASYLTSKGFYQGDDIQLKFYYSINRPEAPNLGSSRYIVVYTKLLVESQAS